MSAVLEACAGLPAVSFGPGEVLLKEGERGNRLFVLLEGEVRVYRGEREVARIGAPEALFGEMSALLDIPYSASVVAATPVRALVTDEARAFIEGNPAIAVHTARLLARRLYHATTYLADLKAQFASEAGHLGMMDEILEALLQQQTRQAELPKDRPDDPRL